MSSRELDIIVYGATGFTGRLVAEYLRTHAGDARWGIAGRNQGKLEALGFGVPIIVADSADRTALEALARRTKVVCTAVGPYAKYGEAIVRACAETGTDYCDVTGEVQFMRRMIDAYDDRARQTGARIVHACGYDSIPSDIGTYLVQKEFAARYGRPATKVTAYFGETSAGFSGGTIASMLNIADEIAHDRSVRRILGNPYALDPDPEAPRPPSPDDKSIGWDRELKMFTIPFVMAATNTRVVRRSHALAGFPYGPNFVYREVMSTPGSPKGLAMAVGITATLGGFLATVAVPRLRDLLVKRLPKPGEGPSQSARERGHWKVRFVAERGDDRLRYVAEDPHGDAYLSSSYMLAEAALCLAQDDVPSRGGVLTPSVALGDPLVERLRAAGIRFAPA